MCIPTLPGASLVKSPRPAYHTQCSAEGGCSTCPDPTQPHELSSLDPPGWCTFCPRLSRLCWWLHTAAGAVEAASQRHVRMGADAHCTGVTATDEQLSDVERASLSWRATLDRHTSQPCRRMRLRRPSHSVPCKAGSGRTIFSASACPACLPFTGGVLRPRALCTSTIFASRQ
jgi:hypothetical protein